MRIIYVIAAYFILVNLIAAHDSYKFSYKKEYFQQVNKYLNNTKLAKTGL